MKLISWNVNGVRAVLKKGFAEWFAEEKPDVLCLQETKAKPEQVELPFEFAGYHQFWNSAVKPGYSGTLILTKEKPHYQKKGIKSVQKLTALNKIRNKRKKLMIKERMKKRIANNQKKTETFCL